MFNPASCSCRVLHFDVGILRPDWLSGAEHLGVDVVDGGFVTDVWAKADFIQLWQAQGDAAAPVRWAFTSDPSREFVLHVMSWMPGRALEAKYWQVRGVGGWVWVLWVCVGGGGWGGGCGCLCRVRV